MTTSDHSLAQIHLKDFGTYMVLTPKTAYVHAGAEDGIHRNCTSMLVLKHALKFGTYQSKTVRCLAW